jgi:hypothetical protein
MVWKPLFWIVFDIYEGGPLINGLIITNYDHDQSIYKVFMYYYDKGHAHEKVSHLV